MKTKLSKLTILKESSSIYENNYNTNRSVIFENCTQRTIINENNTFRSLYDENDSEKKNILARLTKIEENNSEFILSSHMKDIYKDVQNNCIDFKKDIFLNKLLQVQNNIVF